MQPHSLSLFLPLSADRARLLVDEPTATTDELGLPELASVLLIQGLMQATAASLEKKLAQLLELAQQVGQAAFADVVAERFQKKSFAAGLQRLSDLGIGLLDDHEIEQKDYLLADGRWDFTFTARQQQRLQPLEVLTCPDGQQKTLSHQQARLYRILLAEADESMHVQGLAGVGKTHLIRAMLEMLPASSTLLLAFTGAQLAALRSRLGGLGVREVTFRAMADELLTQNLTQPWRRVDDGRGNATYQISDQAIARLLGIQSVGGHSPARVVGWCRQAIRAFCNTTDATLGPEHFPSAGRLEERIDQAILTEYAQLIWQEIIRPSHPELRMPVRGYHRLKQLALQPELRIPATFTHVIVDESHDLPAPLLEFLGRCPQAVYTLGDVCQALHGQPGKPVQPVRQRELFQSLRAGREMEQVVNPLLAAFPGQPLSPMEGNRERATRVRFYDHAQIPKEPTTILVRSEWGLFEWFQRLANSNARFALLPGVEKDFRIFVQDCIELYHRGTPPRHWALYAYNTWAAMENRFGNNRTFVRISDMLARGYSSMEFERSLIQLQPAGQAPILLGRVADARNLEMDSVMLTPDLLVPVAGSDQRNTRRILSAIYTGATRTRFELTVPGYLRDWLLDQGREATSTLDSR